MTTLFCGAQTRIVPRIIAFNNNSDHTPSKVDTAEVVGVLEASYAIKADTAKKMVKDPFVARAIASDPNFSTALLEFQRMAAVEYGISPMNLSHLVPGRPWLLARARSVQADTTRVGHLLNGILG